MSALGREHRSEELARCLPVAFLLANDLVGCIIATIGLPDSEGLILKPAPELDPDVYVGPILTEGLPVGGVPVVQLVFRVQTFAKGNCAFGEQPLEIR